MKKRILLSVMVILAMAVSPVAFAENLESGDAELAKRWNFGISSSGVIPNKSKNHDTGYNVQGLLSYDIFKWVAVGVEAGFTAVKSYITQDVTESSVTDENDNPIDKLEVGNLYACPLMGNIILKAPIEMDNSTLVLYVANGFGVLISDVDESDFIKSWDATLETNTPFLYKLGFGTDFYIGDSVALNFEASYQWADIKYTAFASGSEAATAEIPFDSCYIGGGLKMRF